MADAESLLRALRARPDDAALACDLADVLANSGQLSKAILLYQHALEHQPGLPRACYGAGCAENMRQDFAAARSWFAEALELTPDWLETRHNLARAEYELGRVSDAHAHFQQCAAMNREASAQSRAMLAVMIPGVPEAGPADILAARQAWLPKEDRTAARRPVSHMPMRVAYVSSFFKRDNWMKPVWGLINQHDRKVVQVHLFSDCTLDEIRHGYQIRAQDQFLDTSRFPNDELAAQFDKYGIDLVVDLNGYSNMRRLPLFGRRMTPVVVGWFNHYATTGLAAFDYLIGDECVIHPDEEKFYSEKVVRVQGSYLSFDVSYPVPPVTERVEHGGNFVFGALASQYKITPEVIDAWARILRAAPGSSLLIKNQRMESTTCREFLLGEFERRGVPRECLHLEGPEDHFEFLKAYDRIDVALDTFPYNGGTTTTEALWQGVPVLAFYGDRWVGRTSASILRAGGLGQFVAEDVNGYVELAVKLATDAGLRDLLTDLRRNMRERLRNSGLCDTQGFARQMEKIYQQVLNSG